FSAVVGTIPLILAYTIFAFGAWLLPVNRRWIGSLDDFHYWWSDAIGIQLIRIFGVGFSMQFLGSLFIFLIVVLPVYTMRHPETMLIGSRLSNKMSERTQRSLVKSVTVSISLFTLGALLSGMTKGLFLGSRREMFSFSGLQKAAQSILPQAKEIIINMQYGIFEMESVIWLFGIILLVIGALLFLWVMINIVFEAR